MRTAILWILLLCSCSLFSQKKTSTSYDSHGIEKLYINSDEVFKVTIKTAKTEKIIITSVAQGEYYNDISLDVELESDRMTLTSNYKANLQEGFDKLSAHKVFSLEIELEIPEGMEVFIKSNISSLVGQGSYNYFQAELRSGFCHLTGFNGNALINTYSGGIDIETENATVTATSRSGTIILPIVMQGEQKVELHSITGDIKVRKTK